MTRKQRALVRGLVLRRYAYIGGSRVQVAADGAVSVFVDRMPNTNLPGRIFAGWDVDLLREAMAEIGGEL